jgi:hypothetical protein
MSIVALGRTQSGAPLRPSADALPHAEGPGLTSELAHNRVESHPVTICEKKEIPYDSSTDVGIATSTTTGASCPSIRSLIPHLGRIFSIGYYGAERGLGQVGMNWRWGIPVGPIGSRSLTIVQPLLSDVIAP